jgi:two-component system OmpR family response regulator
MFAALDPSRILIVEDSAEVIALLERVLGEQGYDVSAVMDGNAGLARALEQVPDLVILDLGLPKLDGLSVLRQWRAAGRTMPVLILTARDRWHDKVAGIDAGADDYVAKPFHMEELLARLRALIRRAAGHASPILTCGPIELDTRGGRVTVDGAPVTLTANEYRVLAYLMHHPGKVVSRSELTEHVYAQDFERDSNTIEVFIGRLRRKVGENLIATIRGQGYRLDPPEAARPAP